MTHKTFKNSVNFIGTLILCHLASTLLYSVVFTNVFAQLWGDGLVSAAKIFMLVYEIVIDALFVGFVVHQKTAYSDYRRELRDQIRSGEFSLKARLNGGLLRESCIKGIIYIIFQIPYAIIYPLGILHIAPIVQVMLDFYAMDSAFYYITGVPIIAMILRAAIFVGVNIGVTLLLTLRAKKNVEEEMV